VISSDGGIGRRLRNTNREGMRQRLKPHMDRIVPHDKCNYWDYLCPWTRQRKPVCLVDTAEPCSNYRIGLYHI